MDIDSTLLIMIILVWISVGLLYIRVDRVSTRLQAVDKLVRSLSDVRDLLKDVQQGLHNANRDSSGGETTPSDTEPEL